MSTPVPEESDQPAGPTEPPPGEHPSELPDEADKPQGPLDPSGPGGIDAPAPPGGPQRTDTPGLQQENAGSSLDQPSDDSGGG